MTACYLALGDSYTVGEGVALTDRWPVRLAVRLEAAGRRLDNVTIVARTGWTTTELLRALEEMPNNPPSDFALVSLLIGVNDQYRGNGLASFRAGFDRLLTRSIASAAGHASRVLVVSIPDWSVTPFATTDPRGRVRIAAEIDAFNRAARERAFDAGTRFVDITPNSRRAAEDPTLLVSDGLHPSAAMYEEWAALVLPQALAGLET